MLFKILVKVEFLSIRILDVRILAFVILRKYIIV